MFVNIKVLRLRSTDWKSSLINLNKLAPFLPCKNSTSLPFFVVILEQKCARVCKKTNKRKSNYEPMNRVDNNYYISYTDVQFWRERQRKQRARKTVVRCGANTFSYLVVLVLKETEALGTRMEPTRPQRSNALRLRCSRLHSIIVDNSLIKHVHGKRKLQRLIFVFLKHLKLWVFGSSPYVLLVLKTLVRR